MNNVLGTFADILLCTLMGCTALVVIALTLAFVRELINDNF